MDALPNPVHPSPPAIGPLGRAAELEDLLTLLDAGGPAVAHLHGLPGIGKSALLSALVAAVRARGLAAHRLDCRAIEPTAQGLEQALAMLDLPHPDAGRRPSLVCLDNYESFLLLDAWLRNRLIPRRRHGLRLVFASRNPPNPAWLSDGAGFLEVRLRELDAETATAILAGAGFDGAAAHRIQAIARGHPLALQLAIAVARDHAPEALEDLALPEVVARLTTYFLTDVPDPAMRRALEAASTVRRTTRPLLASMLDRDEADRLYEQLAQMPLVESCRDGLRLHPAVHEAIAVQLRSADPARFAACRRAAWRTLERQSNEVRPGDLWRYTADLIHLVDNEIVREAFFPQGRTPLAVEGGRPADREAVLEIAARHDGPSGRERIAHWWQVLPQAFHLVRGPDRAIVGFYCLFDPTDAPLEALAADPQTAAWLEDAPEELVDRPRRILFLRRWLGMEPGEVPSPIQAACWLDVKRSYLELRPQLRRVYLAVTDPEPYASAAAELGFEPACPDPELPHATAMLDFGPGSVDAWLRRLVQRELGLHDLVELDESRRTLLVGPEQIALTQLEFGVMRALVQGCGEVLGRRRLLDLVWGERQEAVGSNVVDVVIRALRRKLGHRAGAIVTVRGAGYRFDAEDRPGPSSASHVPAERRS